MAAIFLVFHRNDLIFLREAFQKKTTKVLTYIQTGSTLPTWYPSMDKKKFGQVLYFLPYLPIQKIWTFGK